MKLVVQAALEAKLGHPVKVTKDEWTRARWDALNDVYANKLCFFSDIDKDYFINVFVETLCIMKCVEGIEKRLTSAPTLSQAI